VTPSEFREDLDTHKTRMKWMGYRVVKKAWQYVQPFWYNTTIFAVLLNNFQLRSKCLEMIRFVLSRPVLSNKQCSKDLNTFIKYLLQHFFPHNISIPKNKFNRERTALAAAIPPNVNNPIAELCPSAMSNSLPLLASLEPALGLQARIALASTLPARAWLRPRPLRAIYAARSTVSQ